MPPFERVDIAVLRESLRWEFSDVLGKRGAEQQGESLSMWAVPQDSQSRMPLDIFLLPLLQVRQTVQNQTAMVMVITAADPAASTRMLRMVMR